MTSDDIISMAEKVDPYGKLGTLYEMAELTPGKLERFAALVAAAEREACAKLCESMSASPEFGLEIQDKMLLAAAKRIRARGEKGQS